MSFSCTIVSQVVYWYFSLFYCLHRPLLCKLSPSLCAIPHFLFSDETLESQFSPTVKEHTDITKRGHGHLHHNKLKLVFPYLLIPSHLPTLTFLSLYLTLETCSSTLTSVVGRPLVHFSTAQPWNNHTETILFKSLLGQLLKHISS